MAILSTKTVGSVWHIVIDHDPRTTPTKAPVNSIAHFKGVNGLRLFLKKGLADLDWYNITLPAPSEYDPSEFYTVDPITGDPILSSVKNNTEVFNGGTNSIVEGVAIFTQMGPSDADGRITFNMTLDGTPTGPAIFSQILGGGPGAMPDIVDFNDVPKPYIETISQDLKQITVRASRFDRNLQGGNFTSVSAGVTLGITLIGVKA